MARDRVSPELVPITVSAELWRDIQRIQAEGWKPGRIYLNAVDFMIAVWKWDNWMQPWPRKSDAISNGP